MKRLTLLVPLCVLAVLVYGFVAARTRASARVQPSFAPAHPPQFAELVPPLGAATLRGRVLDIDGVPLGDVSLYLRSNEVPHWSVTDAQGRFEFSELAEGQISIAVLAWGHPPRLVPAHTGPEEFEIVLPAPSALRASLPDVVTSPLAGRIAHPMGVAWSDVDGYEIVFAPRRTAKDFGGAVERRVRCDTLGLFAIDDLAHGSYDVRVLPNWAAASDWPNLVATGYSQFEHDGDRGDGMLVGMSCGALEGALRDPDGAPIEGALVLLASSEDPTHIWLPQSTDPEGRYRFADLPPGSYSLVLKAGQGVVTLAEVAVESGRVTRATHAPLTVRQRP